MKSTQRSVLNQQAILIFNAERKLYICEPHINVNIQRIQLTSGGNIEYRIVSEESFAMHFVKCTSTHSVRQQVFTQNSSHT
jgi:hypothetical protein